MTEEVDYVNHPPHYSGNDSGIEVIEVTEFMDFNLGNAFKYVARHEKKFKPKEDLEKAIWYIERYIQTIAPLASTGNTRPDKASAFIQGESSQNVKTALENIVQGYVSTRTAPLKVAILAVKALLAEIELQEAIESATSIEIRADLSGFTFTPGGTVTKGF